MTGRTPTVVVVGGGASGALVAANLLHRARAATFRVVVVEPRGRAARGVAYSTRHDEHVLNVPASNMSAFPDDPDHFLRWAVCHVDDLQPDAYLPRRLYGDYLESVLEAGRRASSAALEVVQDEARALRRSGEGIRVVLRRGAPVDADAVVLATGNPAPSPLPVTGAYEPCVVQDPWSADLALVDGRNPVLLVGSGLTAVDVALTLSARTPERTLVAISRHGLFALPHTTSGRIPAAVDVDALAGQPLDELVRSVRAATDHAVSRGGDWRSVIRSLRPVTQQMWCGLSAKDQSRFLTRLGRFWDVHRHLVAPTPYRRTQELIEAGRLVHRRGELVRIDRTGRALRAVIRDPRTGASETMRLGAVVNCTGPARQADRPSHLVAQLVADGLGRLDPHGIDLETSAEGRIVDGAGTSSAPVFAIGPVRRGTLLESTAIPEIRVQARDLGTRLAERLARAGHDALERVA